MTQPLPESWCLHKPLEGHNAGLWYDKFFNCWNEDFSEVPEGGKTKWTKGFAGECGDGEQLSDHYKRLQCLTYIRGGQILHFKTDGRFVTGLGREHPIENGFAWHHTLGVPFLPGSSVKGMLRAWARESGVDDNDSDRVSRIFGPEATPNACIGSVIVGDGLPPKPVKLAADVMTPHYGPYYRDDKASEPPADWHDPKPIPFLTVDDAQTFAFMLAPRRANNAKDTRDCEIAAQWLAEALTWLGAGAKTAVGYGRFKADEKANTDTAEAIQKERKEREVEAQLVERLQGLSALAQELERAIESARLETDKNAFVQANSIETWLDKLEADPAPDAVRRFAGLVRTHFPGLMEDPHKTKGKKRKPAFNARQRRIAERLHKIAGR